MNVEQELRSKFLKTVEGIVNNDRASQYGGAEDSFLGIAAFWTIYLRNKGILSSDKIVNALDVALMMDLMKTARLTANPMHYDSWIDKAGYSACGGSLVGRPEETKKKDSDDTASKPFVPTTEDPTSSTVERISKLLEFIRNVKVSSNGAAHLADLPKAGLGLIKYQFTEALHNEEGWTNLVSEGFLESDWLLTQEQALHAMKGYGNMLALRTSDGAILATEGDWSNQDYVVCQTTFVAYRKKAGKNIKSIEEYTNGNNHKVIFGYDEALRYMKAHGVYSLVTQTGRELLVNGLWK